MAEVSGSESSVPPADDAGLVALLRAGDEGAFRACVERTMGRLLAVARRMLRDEHLAQDAVQETYLQAFRRLDQFDGRAALATWLHQIAVRQCLMKLRSRRARPELSVEALLPTYDKTGHREAPGPAWRETGEQLAARAETRAFVRAKIEELPEAYRNVILLRDIEELSTQQAAAILEIEENLVKVRLHRARQALRALLERHLRGEAC